MFLLTVIEPNGVTARIPAGVEAINMEHYFKNTIGLKTVLQPLAKPIEINKQEAFTVGNLIKEYQMFRNKPANA